MKPDTLKPASMPKTCWTCKSFGYAIINSGYPNQSYCFKFSCLLASPQNEVCEVYSSNTAVRIDQVRIGDSPIYRCVDCEFDLEGTETSKCPECGGTKIAVID